MATVYGVLIVLSSMLFCAWAQGAHDHSSHAHHDHDHQHHITADSVNEYFKIFLVTNDTKVALAWHWTLTGKVFEGRNTDLQNLFTRINTRMGQGGKMTIDRDTGTGYLAMIVSHHGNFKTHKIVITKCQNVDLQKEILRFGEFQPIVKNSKTGFNEFKASVYQQLNGTHKDNKKNCPGQQEQPVQG